MMGKSHAKQGICAVGITLAASALIAWSPLTEPLIVLLFAGIVIGGSLAPDIDSKGSSATKAYGPVTRLLSWIICRISAGMYAATRSDTERKKRGTHRMLTHTLAGNILAGLTLVAVCSFGPVPAGVAIGMVSGLGAFALMKRYYLLIAAVAGFAAYSLPGVDDTYLPVWGLAFLIGTAVHCFGDSCTVSGTPYFWPLSRDGKRWTEYHVLPERLRIITGRHGEPIIMAVTYVLTIGIIGTLVWINT